jgi:hypothetical protein
MAKIQFDIIGQLGSISAPTFHDAIANALGILRELDTVLSNRRSGALQWYVGDLHANGSLSIEFIPKVRAFSPRVLKGLPSDIAPQVTESFVHGFQNIQTDGTSPPYLSENGLHRIANLVGLINKNGARGFHISDDKRTVDVSNIAAENVTKLIRPKRHAIGSVEGYLRAISLHRGMKVTVYHSRTNKAVSCSFRDQDFLDIIKSALGRKVIALGTVHYNEKGEPVRVDMERLRVFRSGEDLPSTAEVGGSIPDFTDGMSTDDYVRSLRA